MKLRFHPLLAIASLAVAALPSLAQSATTIMLSASSTTIEQGTAVKLMANVTAGNAPVTKGRVRFCDAAYVSCEAAGLLGSAQLSGAGMASLSFVPGLGQHSVKAIFDGTATAVASTSAAASISVTGMAPTVSTLTSSGTPGNYTLSDAVQYQGILAPGNNESVSFTDTTNNNLSLGSATILSLSAPAYAFGTLSTSPVSTGNVPTGVAVADFNGDGIPDLAVLNARDNTVAILPGDGKSGYTAAPGSPYNTGSGPRSILVADFNADGFADLAIANSTAGTITLLLGTSDGHFTAGSTTAVDSGPRALAVADFNNDGIPDLAVANQLSSTVTVLFGDGTGQFTNGATKTLTAGINPSSLVALDVNGDGFADLAIANTTSGTVSILLNDGTGNFTEMPGSPFAVPGYPTAIVAGDFNADGHEDLAVTSGTQNDVTVLLGNGATFTAGTPVAVGASPMSITVSDVNGDSKQDLVVTNTNDHTVTVLLGDGTGNFTAQAVLPNFDSPLAIASADLNGDSQPDLAVVNAGAGSISLRPLTVSQTGTATLASVVVPGSGTHSVVAAYPGDSTYLPSTSNTISLSGSLIPTSLSLFFSPGATMTYGTVPQITASLVPYNSSNYIASGSVSFTDSGAPLGSGTLQNGQAAISVNSLQTGTHSITGSYAGDTNFAASTVTSGLTVVKADTATTLTLGNTAPTAGIANTYTAAVISKTTGTPTGTVQFLDNGNSFGTATLVSGQATLSSSAVAAGVHTITASYSGDNNFNSSSADASTGPVTVVPPTFTFVLTTAQTVAMHYGQQASFTLHLTPQNPTFLSDVNFSASIPFAASSSFSPNKIAAGSSAADVTFTLSANKLAMNTAPGDSFGSVFLCLLALPLAFARRMRRKGGMFTMSLAIAALAGTLCLIGCGSGYPDRTSTITLTAESGGVVRTATVTVRLEKTGQ